MAGDGDMEGVLFRCGGWLMKLRYPGTVHGLCRVWSFLLSCPNLGLYSTQGFAEVAGFILES